ncbi:Wzz/FepE/Etk N-terminal domain-containing protein [Rhizobacter sp. J219]|uniref:Wzz/FepE/Etk N-terminal domain-containing protein n=1 Tax=Rhizobacter sp. J219 TaxID=2898430 RepID=UPI002150F6D1|nr:Wzz/FepE/Etk N-terminal domain-containing protein [Rhizobacter sp. J219]MCR5886056.1 Wzz/FepE/Etk N-terminal domain-containing protein [Rhizobacter sp. J219]
MNFTQFLAILRARWLTALATFLLVLAAVVGVSMLLPPKYKATAAVLVDMRSNDPIAGVNSMNGLPMSYISTQADIITSPRVAQRVVRGSSSPRARSCASSGWTRPTATAASRCGWPKRCRPSWTSSPRARAASST